MNLIANGTQWPRLTWSCDDCIFRGQEHVVPNSRFRLRRWGPAVVAVAGLSMPMTSGSASPEADSHWTSPAGDWAGSWLSTSATGDGTSLQAVRDTIGAGSGAAAALTGKGVGIALIDTGVAPVPGLPASRIVNGPDLSFESQDPDLRYLDTYGHGTHLAGIMVGDDASSGLRGIAPGAKLTSIKVGTASGAVDVSQVLAAID